METFSAGDPSPPRAAHRAAIALPMPDLPPRREPPNATATAWSADAALNERCAGWIRQMAAGDAEALRALHDATVSRLWPLARRILRCDADAEEAVADAYHQAWRQAARFEDARGAPLAWLLTICRTRALDVLRRRDPALPLGGAGDEDVDPAASLVADAEPGTWGAAPDDQVERHERRDRLDHALARLRGADRQLLLMAYFGGCSQTELAAQLGVPLGTVKSRTRRALAHLKQELEGRGL